MPSRHPALLFALALPLMAGAGAGAGAGSAWNAEVQVSAAWGDVWREGIAASGRSVHLIWGEDPIRYRRSLDEGQSWSGDIVLASDGTPVLTDPLVAAGSDVYVVYLRDRTAATDWCCRRSIGDIYFRRSLDGGVTWLAEQRLSTSGAALRVSLAAAGDRLDLVWMDYRAGEWDLYYRRSLDRGAHFEPEAKLVNGAAGFGAERPQVASSGDHVHVVWMDDRDGHPPCYTTPTCPEVYYKRSTDGGATWQADVRLTFDRPFSGRPEVAALGPATVLVVYDDDRDANQGHEQYLQGSEDAGATWGEPFRLTSAPGDSQHPALDTAGAAALLAWFDQRPGGDTAVHSRLSLDRGATWQAEELVAAGKGSTTPLTAVSRRFAHVVWLDSRTGSQQVFYRRRSLDVAGAAERTLNAR